MRMESGNVAAGGSDVRRPQRARRGRVAPARSGVVARAVLEALEARQLLANSAWAFPGADGHMLYAPTPLGDHIEDFSNVGYQGGAVSVPDVAVKATVAAPGGGDDTAAIQAAINSVQALPLDASGFRGAVLLGPGTFRIDGSLNITASGVVLRGSGQNQTILHATTVTDTSERTVINVNGSGTRTTVASSTHTITEKYVPVGAISFSVDSTTNLHVGDTVIVHRPSTQQWINDLGMNLLDNPWTPGSKDINLDRTITHIDGNVITIDAPITQALDLKYTDASQGGNTIYAYTASGRLNNVGVEYLGGYSDYDPSVVDGSGNAVDENHPWTFINVDGSQNAWVRNITADYFGYAAVYVTGNSRWVTVQDSQMLDYVSQITGGRRYGFNLDDSSNCLFRNLYTRQGRHDYVEGSGVAGPNVFVDDRADATHADAGPHHRYSTAALWDNLTVGQLDIQNRGNLGSGHGWAGANQVIWNSKAGSFVVQNPPTAQNWLIGSVGTIANGTVYVGPHDPGIYDSSGPSGPNVTPRSLYYQQLAERTAQENFDLREIRLGDADSFTSADAADSPAVDSTWKTNVQAATGRTGVGLDVASNGQLVPLTFNYTLDPGTYVVGASLSLGLKSSGNNTSADKIYFENPSRSYSWTELGVTPPGSTAAGAVIDLSGLLAALQDGKLNIAINGNSAIDWATLNLQTASTTQPATTIVPAAADAYVRDGTSASTNFGIATSLQTKLDSANNNQESYLKFDLSSVSGYLTKATIRLVPSSVGVAPTTFGSGAGAILNQLSLVSDDSWTETGINWNNRPAASGAAVRTFISSPNAPLNIDVTSLVQGALAGDKLLSLKLASIIQNASGQISYGSRENANGSLRPQLILQTYNGQPPAADAYVRSGASAGSNFGTQTDLAVKKDTTTTTDNNREAYLKFDLTGVAAAPAGATVRLMPIGVNANAPLTGAFVTADTWTETGVNWNTKPASSTVFGTQQVYQATPVKFDATPSVASTIAGDKLLSVRLFSNTISSGVNEYASREFGDASVRPLLVLKNLGPQVTELQDISSAVNTATPARWFGVWDAETAAGSLAVTATSSNTTLLPNANITLGGSGADRTIALSPAAGKTGTAIVTLTVTDAQGQSASTTFQYTVANVTQINGDQDAVGENDAIRIARNGTFLDVTRNNVNVLHVDYASAPQLAVAGLGGNDTITVDFTNGNPIPAAGLSVDGGDGTGDIVSVIGSAASDSVTLASGSVALGGSSFTYLNGEELDLQAGGGTDTITASGNASVAATAMKLTLTGGGTTSLAAGSSLPDFSDLTVATGTTFNLNGVSQTIDALDGAGTVINNGSAAVTLTIGQYDGGGSFSGNLSAGTNSLALTKVGGGTEILSGTSTYTGVTNVNGGALRATSAGALGSTSGGTTISGGTGTGRVELAGGITVAEPITLGNRTGSNGGNFAPHIVNVSGNNTLTGAVTLASGGSYWTLQSDAGKLTVAGNLINANTSNTRTLFLRGAGTGEVSGNLVQTNVSLTTVDKEEGGTWTLSGAAGYTGATIVDGGVLALQTNVTGTSAVTIDGGQLRMATGGTRVLKTPTLTITGGGKLDLTDNRLIVTTAGALGSWNGSAYTGVAGQIAAGRNGGDWLGSGIVSSAAGASDYTTLGLAKAGDVLGIGDTETGIWGGQTVTGSDALVLYTYGGDANLDGVINIDDYTEIDSSVSVGGALKGWFNGDFNYDGNVDIDDYTVIDSNITIQGPPLGS